MSARHVVFVIRCLALAALLLGGIVRVLPAQSLSPAAVLTNAVLLDHPHGLVISPDGSWLLALTASGGATDLVAVEIDELGAPVSVQELGFPSSLNASTVNPGIVMSPDGRFAALYGSGGVGDLIIVRRGLNGDTETIAVDFPGGNVPSLDSRPVIPQDGRYVVGIGSGSTQDLVVVPIFDDVDGLPTPAAPLPVAFPSNGALPFANGLLPAVTRDGDAIIVPGVQTAQDLLVVSVPTPADSAPLQVFPVAYPNFNQIPDPEVAIAVSPDGRWVATRGSATVGDVVVTPLDPAGVPGTAVNVLLPSNNNAARPEEPLLVDPRGRVIATAGTLIAGDLALVPVNALGVPGTPINVAFPANNFLAADAPPLRMSPDGRYVAAAGSATVGDLVVVDFDYFPATNTVSATPYNVLFASSANRRTNADFSISDDGEVIATYGASATTSDLVIVDIDTFGVPVTSYSIALPASLNVSTNSLRPVVDPGGGWVAAPSTNTAADLTYLRLERDASCQLFSSIFETFQVPFGDNFDLVPNDLALAPTRQFLYGRGSASGTDLALFAFQDARIFPLAPAWLGRALPLRFRSSLDGGAAYQAGAAFERCPPIALGDGRLIGLADDPLLQLSIQPMDPAFFGFSGVLDADGVGFGAMFIPFVPEARGFALRFSFVVLDAGDPTGIGTIAATTTIVLR